MTTHQEVQVQEKQEVEKQAETTMAARYYVPTTDIFETNDTLTVVMEMPGVEKSNVDVDVEQDVLTIEGKLDLVGYDGLEPVYTEYNIGSYRRRFTLSNKIDQGNISAELKDGLLTVVLPKASEAKARTIAVN
jgi:HSP20 family molecular chaperone IbpA